jgi:hypothetical protein
MGATRISAKPNVTICANNYLVLETKQRRLDEIQDNYIPLYN